jgi:hypothetical protein
MTTFTPLHSPPQLAPETPRLPDYCMLLVILAEMIAAVPLMSAAFLLTFAAVSFISTAVSWRPGAVFLIIAAVFFMLAAVFSIYAAIFLRSAVAFSASNGVFPFPFLLILASPVESGCLMRTGGLLGVVGAIVLR